MQLMANNSVDTRQLTAGQTDVENERGKMKNEIIKYNCNFHLLKANTQLYSGGMAKLLCRKAKRGVGILIGFIIN